VSENIKILQHAASLLSDSCIYAYFGQHPICIKPWTLEPVSFLVKKYEEEGTGRFHPFIGHKSP